MRQSDVVAVCLSEKSVTKAGYVQKEIKFALDVAEEQPEGTIFLIPARLEECEVPERLSEWHWVDLFHDKGYGRLLRSLRARAKHLPGVASSEERVRGAQTTPRATKSAAAEAIAGEGLEYLAIPAGRFQMGAVPGDKDAGDDQKPRHAVEISKGFRMSKTPVTVAAYQQFAKAQGCKMPSAPDFNKGWEKEDHPIVNVSWDDAVAYCKWAGGRLPTEAEWEYAARGGHDGRKYPWGDEISERDAKYDSGDGTAPVASYAANGFGLYDMAGNVWEWCSDWFDSGYYASSPDRDPAGPSKGEYRVYRGGSWSYVPWWLRCSNRGGYRPEDRNNSIGFRCVREE